MLTIGHSTISIASFLRILKDNGVATLAET
jgi:hypothetical protein